MRMDGFAAQVHAELADAYPDVDLAEDLAELVENDERGGETDSEEEAEFLDAVQEAVDRLARGW
ncbi:hypothetical protein [Streptomyces pinistramenti]|uniref:hypothetical protein n=1 Tax=Streptomyces pinistramenti TaxID=2884812 RepID=UPI001D084586|nr:hypothetical protein [Streptomyces pinistramenti]MCB5911635.1 hypothetical protein [Streptomyces pinistramenti]